MSFSRPSLKELVARVTNDVHSSLGIQKPLKRSFYSAIAFAVSGVAHLLYGSINWAYEQMFIDSANPENKLRHASWAGVTLKRSSYAQRDVEFIAQNGSVLKADTILVRADGAQYKTKSDVTAVNGKIIVTVLSLEPGSNYNISIGETLSFQSVITGINSNGTVLSSNLINGVNEETIEELEERALDRMQRPPHGGSENDYKQWAKEVPGVTRAFVYPARVGLGTVGVSFLMDNESDIIPPPAKVLEVQEYIDSLRPVNSEIFVFAPQTQIVNLQIKIKPNTAAVRTEVENEIKDLFSREAEPDKGLSISKIREAISIASGEEDHQIVSPVGNITPDAGKILMPGTFEFFDL